MSSMEERLAKMREEREAKQKARIEKLREINLRKYSKLGNPATNTVTSSTNLHPASKPVKKNVTTISKTNGQSNSIKNSLNNTTGYLKTKPTKTNKNINNANEHSKTTNTTASTSNVNIEVKSSISKHSNDNDNVTQNVIITENNTQNEIITENNTQNEIITESNTQNEIITENNTQNNTQNKEKTKNVLEQVSTKQKELPNLKKESIKNVTQVLKKDNVTQNVHKHNVQIIPVRKDIIKDVKGKPNQVLKDLNTRKSLAVPQPNKNKPGLARKSMLPTMKSQESVFDRLYKPKPIQKEIINDAEKLRSDPNYLKKVLKDASMIVNKRHTLYETKVKETRPVRRSISAVHFKRISKSEIDNCIHKWASIGEKINKVHLKSVSEDSAVKEDKMVLAVKSERKKVKFQTPCHNFNTPRPQELQAKLQSWLLKRGKTLDSYHHLQCFGFHHITVKPLNLEVTVNDNDKSAAGDDKAVFNADDENKENIALESDSDDESYTENMNGVIEKNCPIKPDTPAPSTDWRQASLISESADLNESVNDTLTSADTGTNLDEVLLGALNDLTELLKEGFEWEQCARWLRAIRERFPCAPSTAAYWECRAQLEERRGDLPASVQCWEEAIAKGTQHSVVDANLDQLLDKFMQLKISPNSGKRKQIDPKLVDVKNVFKSTIIRFAVQQAKIREFEGLKYTVTPVRRSARLSAHWSGKRTPLQVCTSVRQANESLGQKLLFVPNDTLCGTP